MPVFQEETCFRAFYDAHVSFVWRSLMRLGVPAADVSDMTQDVFMVAWKKRESLDHERRLEPWLFAVAVRAASAHRPRAWFRRETPREQLESLDSALSPEAATTIRQELTLVAAALRRIDLPSRAVLILHDFEETSVSEIASSLGLPVKTAYARLYAARSKFEKAYRQATLSGKVP